MRSLSVPNSVLRRRGMSDFFTVAELVRVQLFQLGRLNAHESARPASELAVHSYHCSTSTQCVPGRSSGQMSP